MINTNRIIQTGDAVKESASEVKTDVLLAEISRLYVERCKALQAGNTLVVQLLNHQITELKDKLSSL